MGGLFLKYMSTGALCGWFAKGMEVEDDTWPLVLPSYCLWYACANLMTFGVLFRVRIGEGLIGKSQITGQVPMWSLVVFWPFHLLNYAFLMLSRYTFRRNVPPATEILPDWWMGGIFSNEAGISKWHTVVDLTTEMSERAPSKRYLNVPLWDGNAPTTRQIEEAAKVMAKGAVYGPSLIHCAFGVGRSTTLMCAALVVGGHAKNTGEAFLMIKEKRACVRLNSQMRGALKMWEDARTKREEQGVKKAKKGKKGKKGKRKGH